MKENYYKIHMQSHKKKKKEKEERGHVKRQHKNQFLILNTRRQILDCIL